MVGPEYAQFLNSTNFDHLLPDLCKHGSYQRVYDIAKPFLSGAPPPKQSCQRSTDVGDWFVSADEDLYRVTEDAPIAVAARAPAKTDPLAPPAPQTPAALTARFFLLARSNPVVSGTETRSVGIELVDYPIGNGTVEASITPAKGAPRQGSVKVAFNSIDLTPLFTSRELFILGEATFGKTLRIAVARQGVPMFTMTVTLAGFGEADAAATQAHFRFAELAGKSRCLPHAFLPPRRRPGPRPSGQPVHH